MCYSRQSDLRFDGRDVTGRVASCHTSSLRLLLDSLLDHIPAMALPVVNIDINYEDERGT